MLQIKPSQVLKNDLLVKTFGESRLFETGRQLRYLGLWPSTSKNVSATYEDIARLLLFLSITSGASEVGKAVMNGGADHYFTDKDDNQHSIITDLAGLIQGNHTVMDAHLTRHISQILFVGDSIGAGLPGKPGTTMRIYRSADKPDHGASWGTTLDQSFFDALITSLL